MAAMVTVAATAAAATVAMVVRMEKLLRLEGRTARWEMMLAAPRLQVTRTLHSTATIHMERKSHNLSAMLTQETLSREEAKVDLFLLSMRFLPSAKRHSRHRKATSTHLHTAAITPM